MMATRSEGVIWVLMNFRALPCTRIWSSGGMPWKSKYNTSRRRSLYLISPGLAGVMVVCTAAATTGGGGGAGGAAGGAGGGEGCLPGCRHHGRRRGRWGCGGGGRRGNDFRRRSLLQPLELEHLDRLRLSVFCDGEIGGLLALHRVSV